MKLNFNNLAFKGAVLNINSFSDNHGNLDKLGRFYQNIEDNKDELFLEDKPGNQNALVVVGDWFIAGDTKGYKSSSNANSHYYQTLFFNYFIKKMQDFSEGLKTYFIPGNHELDAGVPEFVQVLEGIAAKVLMTNLNFNASPALKSLINRNKVIQKDILEIQDDKNPKLKHKALFIGINPINMPYYRKDLSGINFINQPCKAGKNVEFEDYAETFYETVRVIKEFKEQNPKGLVVVSIHTGFDFAQRLAAQMGHDNINLILNAHEHKDEIEEVSGVKIVNLNQNFKKYVNAKFFLDDDGDLKSDVKLTEYRPFEEKKQMPFNSFFTKLYMRAFGKDLKKEYKINTKDPDVDLLSVDNVRVGNNYLANFVTDSILSQIQKTNPEVEIFCINALAIRTSLDTKNHGGANNLQMMNVLNGIVHDDAHIYKNEVKGSVLAELVLDNLLFSEHNPERCPITHYSGLIIERADILNSYRNGETLKELTRFIKTPDGKPIEADRTYTVANVEKYFKKSKNALIHGLLYKEAQPLDLNAKDLFIQYVDENKDNLEAKCDTRIVD